MKMSLYEKLKNCEPERPVSAFSKRPVEDDIFESYKNLVKWMNKGYDENKQ